MLKITENKGFHMTFENGMTISCQIGKMNYCDNFAGVRIDRITHEELKQLHTQCENCEVAIWNKDGEYITSQIFKELNLECDEDELVTGFVDMTTVGKVIGYISSK